MENHVKSLGLLNILAGLFGALGGVFFFGFFAGPGAVAAYGPLIGNMITGLMFLMVLLTVPAVILGVGLVHFRPWSRTVGTVISIFELLCFPVGTLLGIYGLWVLMSDETDLLFSPRFTK